MSGSAGTTREFHPIVNALRAVAVVSVVAYHSGLPYITGGFVGVDVFFVISGFLIIGIIARDLDQGRFTFPRFYAKRAFRILPPYLLVVVASVGMAAVVLETPDEIADMGQQVLWSALMVVNHYFLAQQGYFDAAASTKPLLHLWSLAIEEQFYIVAPVAMAGLWMLRRRTGSHVAIAIAAAALFALSLAMCIRLTGDPNYAFFVMPLRAWELIAGGVLGAAIPFAKRMPAIFNQAMVLVGLALIASAAFLFTHDTPFPSFWAAIPVVGTCLAIVGGIAAPASLTVRIATLSPILWIGLVSYSFYLWHWPLLVFGRLWAGTGASLPFDLSMALLALVLANLTYWYVEKPAAAWKDRADATTWRPTRLGLAASAHVALLGFFLAWALPSAIIARYPALVQSLLTYSYDFRSDARVRECWLNNVEPADGFSSACFSTGPEAVFVWGDSHAGRLYPGIRSVVDRASSVGTASRNSCPPLLAGVYERCVESNRHVLARLAETRPGTVVLFGAWPRYFTTPASDEQLKKRLVQVIDQLTSAGIRQVVVLGPAPHWSKSLPALLYRDWLRNREAPPALRMLTGLTKRSTQIDQRMRTWKLPAGARYASAFDALCDRAGCLTYADDSRSVLTTWDYGHLTTPAAALVARSAIAGFLAGSD